MEENLPALKKTARIAGWLYLVFALVAIYGYMYVFPKVIASEEAAIIAKDVVANEFLFRTGIMSNAIGHILFVFVVMMLYQLFKRTDSLQAKWMVGLVLAGIPVALMADVLKIAALRLFEGDAIQAFTPEQMNNLALLCIKVGNYGHRLVTLNWGLWLFPLGCLAYKSGFIPRILGILLFINGTGYVIESVRFVLFPDYKGIILYITRISYFVGEIPLIFWLIIKGVKIQ